ncbi:MAG: ABC transporter ATP-binding protein [Porticoccaceae bacterium]
MSLSRHQNTATMPGAIPAATPAAVQLDALSQHYGERAAVDGVSWRADAGTTLCLLGHSGCGKTTLLRLIAGLERPSAGRVLLDGEEVSGPTTFVPPEHRRIGLVFQDYALFPHLSVLANVMFGLRDSGNRASQRAAAMAALERVRMTHHADNFPHTLSGGEQQRVALARALAPEPRLLLMDEPFSNLDRRLRDRVRDETMALLRDSGTTAVVVTHDPEEAMRIADRIVLMRDGRIVQSGAPDQVYNQPQSLFAARFFCDLNEIESRCGDGQLDTPLGCFAAPGFTPGTALRLCLRPHDVRLVQQPSGIQAEVLENLFLGDSHQLRLRVPGLERPLLVRCGATVVAPGEPVELAIDSSRAMLFAADTP